MDALVLLVGCLAVGAVVARARAVPDGMVAALTWWVVNIALPSTILALVPTLTMNSSLWFLVVPQWAGLAVALLVLVPLGRKLGWSVPTIGAVVLLAGLANTSFVGFPMLEALRGQPAVALGVVADQVGAFLTLSLGGMAVAARFAGRRVSAREVFRKVVTFPPTIALIVAIVAGVLGGLPEPMRLALTRLGQTLSPIALFVVGLRLQLRVAREHVAPLLVTLSFRLVLWPLVTWAVGVAADVDGLVLVVGVLQAGMAPMITATIIAEREGLAPALANATLAYGILASLISVPLLSALL